MSTPAIASWSSSCRPHTRWGRWPLGLRTATTPEDSHAFTTHWSKAGTPNRSLVNDPQYDKLFEEFMGITDEKRRVELARQMQILSASQAYSYRLPVTASRMTGRPGSHFTYVGDTSDYSMMFETMWLD